MTRHATTSQTVGPFYELGLQWLCREDFAGPEVPGERVTITGKMLDGEGQPVPDALLEIWQADAAGNCAHNGDGQQSLREGFSGFGRVMTRDDGSFRFRTIKPGRVAGPDGRLQAPHLVVSVFCRGLLRRLVTRIYFPGEEANTEDFALRQVEEKRRRTLIARRGAAEAELEWDVVLQGGNETVFFDVGM